MKKTLSIHLGRQLFIIEEDAYDRLQQYLHRLEQSFKAEEGIADIMEDIEMRFAELMLSYLGENRKVAGIADIEKGIASLGEPEEISEETIQNNQGQQQEQKDMSRSWSNRRLYRDTEHRILGGVCSGLAVYFSLDPVIVRVAFFLLAFTGIGVPAYILLWIITPDALTPSDRLRMQGKSVTVDALKDEFIKAADRIKNDTLHTRDKIRNSSDPIANRAKYIVRVIGKILGFGFIAGAICWLIFLSLTVFGVIDFIPSTGDSEYLSVQKLLKILIPVNSTYNLMWYTILLVGFSVPLIAIAIGIRLLTNKFKRYLKISLFTLSIFLATGIVFGLISGIKTGRDFAVYAEIEQQHIVSNAPILTLEELPKYTHQRRIVSTGGFDFMTIRKGIIEQDGILLTYRASKDSSFHIYQLISAHGVDRNAALKRSEHIHHVIELSGNKLLIDPHYSFPVHDGMRNQEVEVIIEIPYGKKLNINNIIIDSPEKEYKEIHYSNDHFEPWDKDWEEGWD